MEPTTIVLMNGIAALFAMTVKFFVQRRGGAAKPEKGKKMSEAAERERPKYRDKFQLLNKTEQELYRRLVEATPALIVLAQVSMSQLFHLNRRDGYLQLGEVGRKKH